MIVALVARFFQHFIENKRRRGAGEELALKPAPALGYDATNRNRSLFRLSARLVSTGTHQP